MDGEISNGPFSFLPEWARKWGLHAAGIGGGAAIVYEAIETISRHPELLSQILGAGGLWIAFAIVVLVLVDRRLAVSAELQARAVVASENLAKHVGDLVSRDDARDQAYTAALRYVASNVEDILARVKKMEKTETKAGG